MFLLKLIATLLNWADFQMTNSKQSHRFCRSQPRLDKRANVRMQTHVDSDNPRALYTSNNRWIHTLWHKFELSRQQRASLSVANAVRILEQEIILFLVQAYGPEVKKVKFQARFGSISDNRQVCQLIVRPGKNFRVAANVLI